MIGKLALNLTEAEFGEEDTIVAQVQGLLGQYNFRIENYAEAESLFSRSLKIRINTLGTEHPLTANSMTSLAILLIRLGRYDEAEPYCLSALGILERTLGPEHRNTIISLNHLARLYEEQGKYADAEPLLLRGLATREKMLGPEHDDVTTSLDHLASLYYLQGRYTEAEPLYQRALSNDKKNLNPEDPSLGTSLANLGNLYYSAGNFAMAEPLLRQAVEIWENSLGPNHSSVAIALNNLANLYADQLRTVEAEALYERALAIRIKSFGSEHPDVARTLGNLASLYKDEGRYSEAILAFQKTLVTMESQLGSEHIDVGILFHNMASAFVGLGEDAKADSINRRALVILENKLGTKHPLVGIALHSLAEAKRRQGRYVEAESTSILALDILDKTIGREHPHVAASLGLWSQLRRLQGDTGGGFKLSMRAVNIRRRTLAEDALLLSERDALAYSRLFRNSTSEYVSCFADLNIRDKETISSTQAIILSAKGQVSDVMFDRQRQLVQETDSITKSLAESYRLRRFQLSKLVLSGPGEDLTRYRHQVDSLRQLTRELESQLLHRSSSFKLRQDRQQASYAIIDSFIPKGSTLIECLKWSYHQLDPDSAISRYLTLVAKADGKAEIVNLGDASEIDSLITKYRNALQQASSTRGMPSTADLQEYKRISRLLAEKIWQPIAKHLKEGETLFISPDGALNLVSFAGLIDEDGKYLIEKYPIHYLSAGRDLIRLKDKAKSGNGLFALGDPDFDASPEVRAGAFFGTVYASAAADPYATRNVRPGCKSLSEMTVKPIPATFHEVETAAQSWQKLSDEQALLYNGPNATEDNFKKHAPGSRVIHLATHGYFIEPQCNSFNRPRRFGDEDGIVGENPLLLSGLFFAGANLHGEGADSIGIDDGILTAEEVSAMNLEGTDLVVLSACESGLGEVQAGEGVYGLRRAFQMAGARTVVSALWPVSDEWTAQMMSELYNHSSRPVPARMREMQLTQIKKLRDLGLPDHPFSWGAFIATGDWR